MKSALITGAGKRIGKAIAERLHQEGYTLYLHYYRSKKEAALLAKNLNNIRSKSASIVQANLANEAEICRLVESLPPMLDLLVNNASVFYPTPFEQTNEKAWQEIMTVNVYAPFRLSQLAFTKLKRAAGCVINLIDIHAERPLKNYPVYSISKAALMMQVKSLARELAPKVRVCGVSPGLILWPEDTMNQQHVDTQKLLERVPMAREGSAEDIGETIVFLTKNNYITGQTIAVDGGRTVQQ